MNVDDYNAFCRKLPHTSHVVQWGGAHVWKVAGKVFAIAGWNDEGAEPFVTFKCSDLSYDLLKDRPGLRPAPYLASRGLKWIQRTAPDSMDDAALCDYLAASHRLVASGLPKARRIALGFEAALIPTPPDGRRRSARRKPTDQRMSRGDQP